MDVMFKAKLYRLILTDHARFQMALRDLDLKLVAEVIQDGLIKPKEA